MTAAQRRRAAIAAELSGARLWLAEIRAVALRRGHALGQLRDQVTSGAGRAYLYRVTCELLAVGEAADDGLAFLADDLGELLAEIDGVVNTGLRAGEGRGR